MIVIDNTEQKRFELEVEGQIVFAAYRIDGNDLYINHVETPEALRGKGMAGRLMEGVMKIASKRNYRVIPVCAYAVSWLRKNDKYQNLVA